MLRQKGRFETRANERFLATEKHLFDKYLQTNEDLLLCFLFFLILFVATWFSFCLIW